VEGIVPVWVGCPLFDRPKRGTQKAVPTGTSSLRSRRRAGRAAADGSASRRGRESKGPEGSSRGLASLRQRFAKRGRRSYPCVPLCVALPSESPHRERPGQQTNDGSDRLSRDLGERSGGFQAGGQRCGCAMHCALTPTIGRVHRGPDKPAVVANAIGHSFDRAGVSANDDPIGRSGEGRESLPSTQEE
jgi:hypothetical protein